METAKSKKVISRNGRIELAIETMRQAIRQFEETGYGITCEDIGPLYVAYAAENKSLYISARDMEDGWELSFDSLADKLVDNLTGEAICSSSRSNYSILLASGLREVADKIERKFK